MFGYALTLGLDPPMLGWAWQLTQLLELNPGPRPFPDSPDIVPFTESVWMKRANPFWKYSVSSELNPAIGCPAPTATPRGPGSRAVVGLAVGCGYCS